MILILGAMSQEVSGLLAKLRELETRPLIRRAPSANGAGAVQDVHYGKIGGRLVALTCAGVGKVQAALCAATLLERHVELVSHLLFMGVAGGLKPELEVGDLVVASSTLQHDVDATALNAAGFELVRGQLPFTSSPIVDCDPRLVELGTSYEPKGASLSRRSVHVGRILSGDQFISASVRAKLGYLDSLDGFAVEMEGAAVAVAAQAFGVPHLIVRTISDKADGSGPQNFAEFMATIAVQNTVGMVEHILAELGD